MTQFNPFDPNPQNVLLNYLIDTDNIAVSERAGEALTNCNPTETAGICRSVRNGTPFSLRWGIGTATLRWSERQQQIILTTPRRI